MTNKLIYIILAIGFGILPSFIWLSYFLKKDPKPEPKRTLLLCFFYGMLATLPVIYFESLFSSISFFKRLPLVSLFLFAFTEEFFKFFSAKISVARKKEFDEAIDPMIYLITAAMGFALVENWLYLLAGFFEENFGFFDLFFVALGRFLGATFLHASASALLGYFWALSILKMKKSLLILGIIFSTFLHAGFNFAIYSLEKIGFKALIFLFLLFFLLLLSLPLKLAFKKLRKY